MNKGDLRLEISPAVAPAPVAPVALGKLNKAFCNNSMIAKNLPYFEKHKV